MAGQEATELDAALRERVGDTMTAMLPQVLRRELPVVSDELELMEDLGLTSTTTLELLLGLEEELQIQIDMEEFDGDQVRSVGHLADYVASHSLPA